MQCVVVRTRQEAHREIYIDICKCMDVCMYVCMYIYIELAMIICIYIEIVKGHTKNCYDKSIFK